VNVTARVISCAVLAGALVTACSRPGTQPDLVPRPPSSSPSLRIQVAEQRNEVQVIPLEEYVRGAVLSEAAAPSGNPTVSGQMLQVQAIVARTYALANRGRHSAAGFDLCSSTHCQLFQPSRVQTSTWVAAATEAVRATSGLVLWHQGAAAVAVFHADCGGHTTTPLDAWSGSGRAYLKAVPDDGPAEAAHAMWTSTLQPERLRQALNADERTAVGEWLDSITVLDRNASGRAETVALHGERERLVKGEVFRDVVSRQLGARTLKSTLFTVRRDRTGFVFEGKGFGHGVGLCQAGALACLRAGFGMRDVLERYYPGTSLHELN
jgi:stage II sporulation protein D